MVRAVLRPGVLGVGQQQCGAAPAHHVGGHRWVGSDVEGHVEALAPPLTQVDPAQCGLVQRLMLGLPVEDECVALQGIDLTPVLDVGDVGMVGVEHDPELRGEGVVHLDADPDGCAVGWRLLGEHALQADDHGACHFSYPLVGVPPA